MYYVYALANKDKRLYIGITNSLSRRLKEHIKGYHRSTKGFRPYKLIYQEKVSSRLEARKKEKYLKTGSGREFLKNLIAAGWRSSISQGS